MDRSADPLIPILGAYPAGSVGLRRFGIYENDLAVDFDGADKSALITKLLEQCAVDPDNRLPLGFFRDLSIGRRLECLLALSAGREPMAFSFPFRCSGCREEIELELTLEEIAELQRRADGIEFVEVDVMGRPMSFRKPNGRDQEKWAGSAFSDQAEAKSAMIRSLALSQGLPPALSPETMDRIEDAMEEADPLVNFLCRITCGECHAANGIFVDLCDAALGALVRMQRQLLGSVHKLASHYHWTERDIFAIPDWRRKEYLHLIAAGR